MNLAHRIQTLRKQKGLSQEELALEIGVSRQAVSKWESEQAQPELDKIIQLSEFFDVSTDYLLKGVESVHTNSLQNTQILSIVPTSLNALGLIITIFLLKHYQTWLCYLPVFIFNTAALMIYYIGFTQCPKTEKTRIQKKFWRTNIWLIAFIPIQILTSTILFVPPSTIIRAIALLPYLALCLVVAFITRP